MKSDTLHRLALLLFAIAATAAIGYTLIGSHAPGEVKVQRPLPAERIWIEISGEVVNPGKYKVNKHARICDVIYAAGGVTARADTGALELDAIVSEGTVIKVPAVNEESNYDVIPRININTADADSLMLIPGIGEKLADRIIDYRRENGKFAAAEDLMKVDGIGETSFQKIKEYIITEELPK